MLAQNITGEQLTTSFSPESDLVAEIERKEINEHSYISSKHNKDFKCKGVIFTLF